MTWQEIMANEYGYKTITTFWEDFTIADKFGLNAIKNTFFNALMYAKTDYKVMTELVMVLNHKIWQHYQKKEDHAKMYDALWRKLDSWCLDNLKDDELNYYLRTLD